LVKNRQAEAQRDGQSSGDGPRKALPVKGMITEHPLHRSN
jgi:hypothetical protein